MIGNAINDKVLISCYEKWDFGQDAGVMRSLNFWTKGRRYPRQTFICLNHSDAIIMTRYSYSKW